MPPPSLARVAVSTLENQFLFGIRSKSHEVSRAQTECKSHSNTIAQWSSEFMREWWALANSLLAEWHWDSSPRGYTFSCFQPPNPCDLASHILCSRLYMGPSGLLPLVWALSLKQAPILPGVCSPHTKYFAGVFPRKQSSVFLHNNVVGH